MTLGNRAFEFFLRSARTRLEAEEGADFAAAIAVAAREEYTRILPTVPDIGGSANVFQPVMLVNGWIAALHRALSARGRPASQTIAICHAVVDGWLRKIPTFLLRLVGRLTFSGPARAFFESQASRSRERGYPADFVWSVENGPDGEFSLVFDECAVNKWYDANDLHDLKPYCNFFDVTYSRLMGMGVNANDTIGLGCERCALRFKHGRDTQIPSMLGPIIRDAESSN